MCGRNLYVVIAAAVTLFLAGCTHHSTTDITSRLTIDDMYQDYQVKPRDLAQESRCSSPASVRVVNAEPRSEEILGYQFGLHKFYIVPREVVDAAVSYLKAGYRKSGIQPDDSSAKTLELKLLTMDGFQGMWTTTGVVQMEVTVPEQKLSKRYLGKENAQIVHAAVADAIHLLSRDIIEDPDLQRYLLCK